VSVFLYSEPNDVIKIEAKKENKYIESRLYEIPIHSNSLFWCIVQCLTILFYTDTSTIITDSSSWNWAHGIGIQYYSI